MTTFIVDDQSAQTTIGEFLRSASDETVEIRDGSGVLLATVIVSSHDTEQDARYEALAKVLEQDQETIHRRRQTPLEDCLTTGELQERLEQLDADE